MRRVLQDVRFGLRLLARAPLLTAVVALTLGFGIGANTAIFSFANALLLRPYPFPDLDRLVTLGERHPQQGGQASVRPSDAGHPLAPADFLDLRAQARSFEGMAALRQRDLTLAGQGDPERLMGVYVSPQLFTLLRADALLGRTLRPEEAQAGRDTSVVLSHGLWQRRFGAAADVLGRSLSLDGRPFTVVGVMPRGFNYPTGGVALWVPLAFSAQDETERGALSLRVLGRLAPGATLESARAELREVAGRLEQTHPRTNSGRTVTAVLLREQQAGLTGPFVALFQGAALLVLMVACANVGGVLLARGLFRRREMALRAALGASRGRIAGQLLTESFVLAVLGGLVAVGVAAQGVRMIRASVPQDITKWVAGWSEIRLDARALAFALLAALATAVLTGLVPALAAARVKLVEALRDGGRGTTGGRHRARSGVVAGQMGLAFVLLVGASLMVRGFGRLLASYEGLRPDNVLTFRLRLPAARYPAGRPVADFQARLLADLARVPGVESAAAVSHLPGDLGPMPGGAVSIQGRSAPGDRDLPMADYQPASADYFRTLGLPVVAGRGLEMRDTADAPPVALVSESMARRLWPGTSALGQHVKQGRPDEAGPWHEVVGVVQDVTQYWFDKEPRSMLYLPHEQAPRAAMFVLVRARQAEALGPAIRARVAALDPALPLDEVRTLRQVVDDGMAIVRLAWLLLLVLGGVALGLSALGVYGVMAHDVARRTQEMGVRLALGAAPAQLRRLVLRRALRLSALALLAGVPAAMALGRVMAGALFGIVRPDAALLALFAGGLTLVALLAGWAPARRAAALDPVRALRAE
jgi:putative ABC transport system permease protein